MKGIVLAAAALGMFTSGAQAQVRLGPAGQASGAAFSDACTAPREVRVRSGYWIDAIQLVCGQGPLPLRGGTGGGEHVFVLEPGEQIRAIAGSAGGAYGPFLYSIRIVTDRRSSAEFGNGGPSHGSNTFSFDVPAGSVFAGIFGAASDRLHQFGVLAGAAEVPPLQKPPVTAALAAVAARDAAALSVGPVPGPEGSGSWCPQPRGTCYDAVAPLQWQTTAEGVIPDGSLALGEVTTAAGRRPTYVCRAYLRRGSTDAGTINGSIRAGDAGCAVVLDAGLDGGGRRVLVARNYEVMAGQGLPGILTAARGTPPSAMQASAIGSSSGYICLKMRPGSRGVLGRVSSNGSGCVIVSGGQVTVSPAYSVLIGGGS